MEFESVEELKKMLLGRFGITIPPGILLKQTKAHGIRVYSASIRPNEKIFGLEGFMAYSKTTGLSQHFIRLMGHLAKRNVIALNRKEALSMAEGMPFRKAGIKSIVPGLVVVSYKSHVLGYGMLEGKGNIKFRTREKERRALINDVSPYPGRNI